jgi:hypothetical protein
LNFAILGIDYEDDNVSDFASEVWVYFNPPNAVISDTHVMTLIDLKV